MDVLPRVSCSIPVSLDLIEPNLYLGGLGAAVDINTLVKYKITHILTVDSSPLLQNILEMESMTTKFIQISDSDSEDKDLLNHFDETDGFIREALTKGAILVHCFDGVSGSATVVIAHLMKKYQITCKEAVEQVKSKRKIVNPNCGFMSQLQIYEEMGYKLDPDNVNYKQFQLTVAACGLKKRRTSLLSKPASLDLIEPNLYLGGLSAAVDINTLLTYKITHILTLDSSPLPQKIVKLKNMTTKFIRVSDTPTADLLNYFDETDAFVSEALSKGAILVHCYVGKSRSATVVIAHLMKKYRITMREALARVRSKREQVNPNYGFKTQLQLYEEMGYKLDRYNMNYKKYLLTNAARELKLCRTSLQSQMYLVEMDPVTRQEQLETNVYRCKECHRVLALESNLITHKRNEEVCTQMYFLEPLGWMTATHLSRDKLCCPQCKAQVGSFDWTSYHACPCGYAVFPYFCLTPSNVLKNVEIY